MPRVQAPLKKANARSWGVEHHLLRLPWVGPHEQHATMAEPDMRDLDRDGHAVDQHDLVAPVELVGLARRKAQWHIGLRRRRPTLLAPALGVTPDRVVAAVIARGTQRLEYADQRQALA